MENSKVQEILEKQVLTVAKAVEDKINEEISTLDRLDHDDLEALKERRLQQMKKMAEKRSRWIGLGHDLGSFSEAILLLNFREDVLDDTNMLLSTESKDRQGTSIRFLPDKKIFTTAIEFDYNTLARRIRELAFLNPKLTITLRKEDNDPKKSLYNEYFFAGGLIEYVKWLNTDKKADTYKGKKFNAICHFFGYQARGSLPSKFDCDYAYVLGHICYHILAAGLHGYKETVTNLKNPVNKWCYGAAPITAMMMVKRWSQTSSIGKPTIHPVTVDLKGKAYELLRQNATRFLLDDIYRNPGPLQFDGPGADAKAVSLCVEDQDYMDCIKKLQEYLDKDV